MLCPACSDVPLATTGACHACGGVWLDEQHVIDRAAGPLQYTGGVYSERRCPVCDEKMAEPLVFDIPIDRCDAHGMWFDKAELEEVLVRSRSEKWRKHHPAPAVHHDDQVDALIAVMRIWHRKRDSP